MNAGHCREEVKKKRLDGGTIMIKGKFSSGKQLYTFQAEDLCDFLGSTQLHSFSQSVQSLHVSLC